MSKVIGAVYPIPIGLVNRIFHEKRNVFVKFTARGTSTKLTAKHRIVFYASHGSKEIVGEGVIEKTEFLFPEEALTKYGDKMFISKEELREYMTSQPGRESKKMLVIVLSKLREYKPHITYDKPITMTGRYLMDEEYKSLFSRTPRLARQ